VAAFFAFALAWPVRYWLEKWIVPKPWHAVLGGTIPGVAAIWAGGNRQVVLLAAGALVGAVGGLTYWTIARPGTPDTGRVDRVAT
jgi:hypothetical protein